MNFKEELEKRVASVNDIIMAYLPEAKGYALHLLPPSEPQRNG